MGKISTTSETGEIITLYVASNRQNQYVIALLASVGVSPGCVFDSYVCTKGMEGLLYTVHTPTA